MGGIATASEEQSQGIDQINTAIQQMNSVTQENAASAEELAAVMATFTTETSGATARKTSGLKRAATGRGGKRILHLTASEA
ncbi:MAG: hypothetical protein IH628_03070 [Proteobacteria bacterium]|nr:hypothetical protein [Pseudomonadota bacterium]